LANSLAMFFKEFYKTGLKYVGLTMSEPNRLTPKAIRVGRIICEFGIEVLALGAKRRRTWREIQASILECLVSGPSTQNKVMTSTNLNRDTAGDYLRHMISLRLVQILSESKEHKVYSVTEKGKRWLRLYKSLLAEEESKE
jgi:predicted transcriptional regulator